MRVKVCVNSLQEENCQKYPSATYPNKPTGLLQKYGETKQLNFGLITGSYGRNKSGGVLRKKVGNMLDEINTAGYGTFAAAPATGSIIKTLDLLRLFGYSYASGQGSYITGSPGDNCGFGRSSFTEGQCSNWGNPQSEIYYESLRYLAGVGNTANFSNGATDAGYISGLTQVATWSPVLSAANQCAPLNILQFNASSNSYDVGSAGYPGLTNIGIADTTALDSLTNTVGDLEAITGTERFVGRLTSAPMGATPPDPNANQLCTAKVIDKLSNVAGTCPDSPRLDGGYSMVGLARHARNTGISTTFGPKKVRTYGVALAPNLPKVEIAVPGSAVKKVIIQPACRNMLRTPTHTTSTNCAIVDFKIVSNEENVTISGFQSGSLTLAGSDDATAVNGTIGTQGKLYVNWEDSEQGGDYDQDMWGVINYAVTSTKVVIETEVVNSSTPHPLGFGYVLTGTNRDGFNVFSGINSFTNAAVGPIAATCTLTAGNLCDKNPRQKVFDVDVASSSASFLESPLFYAAKWGGYDAKFESENSPNLDTKIAARAESEVDTYFYATDPKTLASQIAAAFEAITKDIGAAAAVATNTAYLQQGSFVFQSQFNTADWSGSVKAYEFDKTGNLSSQPVRTTDDTMAPHTGAGREVYTFNGAGLVSFSWTNLTDAQKLSLQLPTDVSDVNAQNRVDWLLGNDTNENAAGGLRKRDLEIRDSNGNIVKTGRNIVGDLVNSSPVYVGAYNFRYYNLPGIAGTTYRQYVEDKKLKKPSIFVGSNNGMMHAFSAYSYVDPVTPTNPTPLTNTDEMLKELFAYIPNLAFPKLANLTKPDYGTSVNPHQYVVDGPIATGDVYIGGSWKTIIVGTLGGGGKGIYALDVTDVNSPKVLFELGVSDYPQLGFVLGTPQIVPMTNKRWAVIFGNGSDTNSSQLFIVDIEKPFEPDFTKVIDTGSGAGLSAPELLTNAIGQVIGAYAGDLSGNLWRFDLSGGTAAQLLSSTETQIANRWKKDYLLFTAKDASGKTQPIYAAPTLGVNSPKGGVVMVYFGTGKYFDPGDNIVLIPPNEVVNSMYAIADVTSLATPRVARSSLMAKTKTTSYSATPPSRTVNEANPNWATQNGWYMDFDGTTSGERTGERILTTPLLIADKLIFTTFVPSSNPCARGGGSWLMEVVAVGDKYVNVNVLEKPIFLPPVLGPIGLGLTAEPGVGKLVIPDTGAKLNTVGIKVPRELIGRQSWRQLR